VCYETYFLTKKQKRTCGRFFSDLFWSFVIFFNLFQSIPIFSDLFQSFSIIFDHFWSFSIIFDHFWSFSTIFDHFWSFSIIFNHFWSFLIIFDHFWLSLSSWIIFDLFWSFLIFFDLFWSFSIFFDLFHSKKQDKKRRSSQKQYTFIYLRVHYIFANSVMYTYVCTSLVGPQINMYLNSIRGCHRMVSAHISYSSMGLSRQCDQTSLWKIRPKCSPTHFQSKFYITFLWTEVAQTFGILLQL
jgi:hypothetical protein